MAKRDHDEVGERVRSLVATHGRAVESALTRLERDPATREELWAEVFAVAYVKIDRLNGLSELQTRGWLLRTARFVAANEMRRSITRRNGAERVVHLVTSAVAAEDEYLESLDLTDPQDRSDYGQAWSELSPDHRAVLQLDAEGFDGPEIAARLGIGATAVRSRLMRARQSFLAAFDADREQR